MSFKDKLGLATSADITARMDLVNAAGEVVRDLDGEPGWIEFYGPDADPVKRFRRQLEAEQYIELQKRQRKGNKLPTEAEAERELEKMEAKLVDALVLRVKDWRLVTSDGEVLEVECTRENVKALFGDSEYAYLRREATEFCGDNENFFG